MKRSEINRALREMEAMCQRQGWRLPPFCGFTPAEWLGKGREYDEVRDCMLGWDITDYGLGDFERIGFSLITIRNGNRAMGDKYPKSYAEKLLFLKEGQYAPNHFHWYKTEDIINRGGGNVLIRVYNSLPNEEIDYDSPVTVSTDGRSQTVPAGARIRLTPGESITIRPRLYQGFLRGGRQRGRAAGGGQSVQRRQQRQPLRAPRGPLPGHRGGRSPLSPALQRISPRPSEASGLTPRSAGAAIPRDSCEFGRPPKAPASQPCDRERAPIRIDNTVFRCYITKQKAQAGRKGAVIINACL